jgi:hypothetical protein
MRYYPFRGLSFKARPTIGFYQGLLGFPLAELIENRDCPGSSHFLLTAQLLDGSAC